MLPELLQTTNLFHLLHRIDIDLAEQQQKAGCPFCGGSLHYSSYQRKPRGGPDLPEDMYKRFSFCCGNEKCRRRTLPPSTLFMDRRVYFRAVILIVTTLSQCKPQEYSKNMLSKMFEINRKTINRWLKFFRDIFPQSRLWKSVRGRLSSSVYNNHMPGSLVEYYIQHSQSSENAITNCLRLLATGLQPVKTMAQ
jgi:hypothetical protein